jgi:hypothetical protein
MRQEDSENLRRIADALDPPYTGDTPPDQLPGFLVSGLLSVVCLVGLKVGYEMTKTIDHSAWGFVGLLIMAGSGLGVAIMGFWTIVAIVVGIFKAIFR